jgi:hypothetical protein
VAVSVRHCLVRLLGGGVETDRMIGAVVLRERQPAVRAIHRTGGRIEEVLDACVAAPFEHVEEGDHIRSDIRLWFNECAPDARLHGEMDDAPRPAAVEQVARCALLR